MASATFRRTKGTASVGCFAEQFSETAARMPEPSSLAPHWAPGLRCCHSTYAGAAGADPSILPLYPDSGTTGT